MKYLLFSVLIVAVFTGSTQAKSLEQELQGCVKQLEFLSSDSKENCVTAPSANKQTSNPMCENLAEIGCRPGSFDDGTFDSKIDPHQKLMSLYGKSKTKIESLFLKKLKDPKNTYFLKAVMSAFRQSELPDCAENPKPSESCYKRLSELLTKKESINFSMYPDLEVEDIKDVQQVMNLDNDPVYLEVSGEVGKMISKELYVKKEHDRIEKDIFPNVRSLLLEFIQENVKDEKAKVYMTMKVNAIRFDKSQCESNNKKTAAGLLVENAFYSPISNSFKYCNGYLYKNPSEFSIVKVIAHELAHSIDPCWINEGPKDFSFQYSDPSNVKKRDEEFPFQGVPACLRSPSSVRAHRQPVIRFKDQPEKKTPSPYYCSKGDQIGESFSDWIGAELLPRYVDRHLKKNITATQIKNGYLNLAKGYCTAISKDTSPRMGETGVIGYDEHPVGNDRINRIFLAQPQIRKQIGCGEVSPKDLTYCKIGIDPKEYPPGSVEADVVVLEEEKPSMNNGEQNGYPNLKGGY